MNVIHHLDFLPRSMTALIKKLSSWNADCSIPQFIGSTPNPLVAFCSMEESSSWNHSIAYDLKSQIVLTDPSPRLGKLSEGCRGRRGGITSRGRGRKSKLDHAKVKALFDQVVGTQLSITRALRESGPFRVDS